MIQIKGNKKKAVASALTFCFFLQQSFCLQVLATNISNVTGVNGVYNIDPTAINSKGVGVRQYSKFELSAGDIANLIFRNQDGETAHTFLNLVDNKIDINGIVNTLSSKDGGFTNGHAVFISPNGMVVGSSGVINAGSLTVLTPDSASYEKYKGDVFKRPSLASDYETHLNRGGASVTVDGRIAARDLVRIDAGDINVNTNALIMAGVNDASTKLTSKVSADALFNKLVNTTSVNNASGNIKFLSYGATGGTVVKGNMKNFGAGNIEITNEGSKGINISGSTNNLNGNTLIKNNAGALNISGTVNNEGGNTVITNNGSGIFVTSTGKVTNDGQMLIVSNTGSEGLNIDNGGLLSNTAVSTLTNTGAAGMNIKGHVLGGTVNLINSDSNIVIGDTTGKDYINSKGNVNILSQNGNIFNYGTTANLIRANGNLKISAKNGAVGKEVGPCDGGICTGIGLTARDLTKSVNTQIDGTVNVLSDGNNSLINLASLNTDLNVDRIKADGRVILLADSSNKASQAFDIVNRAAKPEEANVEGAGISMIASGSIGEKGNALTFRQNGADVQIAYDNVAGKHVLNYKNNSNYGVDMLAINNINVKGLDGEDGSKVDTNVCGMIARTGDINAEFSGDTYIREITAKDNINLVTRGKNMYIDNLGIVPTYPQDYYGPNGNIIPDKVKITALDLGTSWPDNPADSTIVVKNGKINGQGNGRPYHEQDVTLVADNVYAGGYYFNMGNHRDPNGKSTVVMDPTTNPFENPNGNGVSIRGKAVRPDDVKAIGQDPDDRNYYYGGSSQGNDPDYDGVNGTNDPNKQGTEDDDDNLVIPEPEPSPSVDPDEPDIVDTDSDNDTDIDNDMDNDADSDADLDKDPDDPVDSDTDNDLDADTDTDTDIDTDPDDPKIPDDGDTDSDNDTDLDNDMDNDSDSDADLDKDPDDPIDSDTDSDIDADTDTDTDIDTDPDIPVQPQSNIDISDDYGKYTYKQRVVDNPIYSIDKRQYMRFSANESQTPINLANNSKISSVLDISRGGMAVAHNRDLKVGDIVPVQISYGDLNINTDVKIVSATDRRAGAEFINLDQATKNKILYMNIMLEEQLAARMHNHISMIK